MPAPGLTFRTAGPADVPAVVALVESAYRGEASRAGWTTEADLLDGQRTDAGAVRELLDDPDAVMLLAEQQGAVVGSVLLRSEAPHTVYVGMFAVRPDRQNGGLGRQILAEAERLARARWAASTVRMQVLDVRASLIDWYERRGYRPTGAQEPFPYGNERFGIPRRADLRFAVLEKRL